MSFVYNHSSDGIFICIAAKRSFPIYAASKHITCFGFNTTDTYSLLTTAKCKQSKNSRHLKFEDSNIAYVFWSVFKVYQLYYKLKLHTLKSTTPPRGHICGSQNLGATSPAFTRVSSSSEERREESLGMRLWQQWNKKCQPGWWAVNQFCSRKWENNNNNNLLAYIVHLSTIQFSNAHYRN